MSETSKLLIRVWPRLKGKIARHVERRERNMNDVLVQMLAEHYGIPYEETGRKSGAKIGATPRIMLYLPADLRDAIDLDAEASNETARDVVVRIICGKLGEEFKPGGRWGGRASAAA